MSNLTSPFAIQSVDTSQTSHLVGCSMSTSRTRKLTRKTEKFSPAAVDNDQLPQKTGGYQPILCFFTHQYLICLLVKTFLKEMSIYA